MERIFNGIMVLILSAILLGAFSLQLFWNEMPCPLCYLQRIGMCVVAGGGLMNLRFGIRPLHYGLSLLACFFGGFVALRQMALHACPGFPKFGVPFWGLSLYTWSFIIFSTTVFYIALLLLIFNTKEEKPAHNQLWTQILLYLFLVIAGINMIATLLQCGIGPCK